MWPLSRYLPGGGIGLGAPEPVGARRGAGVEESSGCRADVVVVAGGVETWVGTDGVRCAINWLVAADVPEVEEARRICVTRLACFGGFAFFTARRAAADRSPVT
jgi:hypothetical protein